MEEATYLLLILFIGTIIFFVVEAEQNDIRKEQKLERKIDSLNSVITEKNWQLSDVNRELEKCRRN